jgi:hypothetical protein
MSTENAVKVLATSILDAIARGHQILYCEVSADEYRAICQEHYGGPWLGKTKVCNVPIRVRY